LIFSLDVYIGILAKRLEILLINIQEKYFPSEEINESIKESMLKSSGDKTFFLIEKENIGKIWNTFKDAYSSN
jgi:hypothetical protein